MLFATECGKIGLLFPGQEIEVPESKQLGAYFESLEKLQNYDRFIYRDDNDHGLYHKDEFSLEKTIRISKRNPF